MSALMSAHALHALPAVFGNAVTRNASQPNARAMADSESYATVYESDAPDARPVGTLSRPRRFGSDGLYKLSNLDGRTVAAFNASPKLATVRYALAAFARAGVGLADMTAAELAAELADSNARALENRAMAESASYSVFVASALCRAYRAERRAELAAGHIAERESVELAAVAVRATTPAIESALRAVGARVAEGVATCRDVVAYRVMAAALAARAARAELESAFALRVRPIERAPVYVRAYAVESF